MRKIKTFFKWFAIFMGVIFLTMSVMWFVVQDRIQKYPQLGTDWVPKTDQQRRQEAMPKQYIGR